MTRARIRWLYDELPELVRRGVLDEAAARRVRAHYGPAAAGPDPRALLLAVFGALGATLVAGGVVLLLAHNWEDLPRPARAGLAFGILLAAQGLAGWVLARRRDSLAWREGSAAALTGAVVASIALIAQTYHLPGDLGSLLFTWALLTVPVAYLMDSALAAAAVWAIAGAWVVEAPGGSAHPEALGWVAPALLMVPFGARWVRRRAPGRAALVGWAATISSLVALVRLVALPAEPLTLLLLAGFFGAALAGGAALERRRGSGWSWTLRPLTTLGTLGLGALALFLGLGDVWGAAEGTVPVRGWADGARVAVTVGLLVAAAAGALWHGVRGRRAVAALGAVAAWVPLGWLAMRTGSTPEAALGVVSHLLAGVAGVAALVDGRRSGRLGQANGGLVLVAAVALLRFFDTDVSFVLRGVGFIAVGLGFLVLNLRMLRRRSGEPA